MASERVVLDLDAPPEAVWLVTGERWDEVSRIIPSISDSRLVEGTAVDLGVARRCDLNEPRFGMEFIEERLIDWDPPRSFTYEMIDPPFPLGRLGNTWSVEENGHGSRVVMEPFAELRGRPLTAWLEGVVLRRMIASLESDQQAMKDAIEAAANMGE